MFCRYKSLLHICLDLYLELRGLTAQPHAAGVMVIAVGQGFFSLLYKNSSCESTKCQMMGMEYFVLLSEKTWFLCASFVKINYFTFAFVF